ncbi:MAG: GNAT family N-acetyltransferase [Polyangiaceae bacterium]|nr:GNAT family N-acetyltransferase [Polyangiaceae bacterium]
MKRNGATEDEDQDLEAPGITVRSLTEADLDDIVRIDVQAGGRARREYYKLKLRRALEDTSVRISLAAEKDGAVVGFLMGAIYYGDYGQPEPVATLEDIGVMPAFARQGVGAALWRQLARNVKAMRVDRIQTQVDWTSVSLLSFLYRRGFTPAPRLCLERRLDFERDE